MLDITNSILLMTVLFNVGLSVFILRNNWKRPTNFFLGIYLIFLALWACALIGTQIGNSYDVLLYSAKACYVTGLIIASSFYLFTIAFPEDVPPKSITIWIIYGVSILYSLVLLGIPHFLTKRIITESWGNAAVLGVYAYLTYATLFVCLYFGGIVRIWRKWLRASDLTRKKLLIIGAGIIITGIGGFYFDVVLDSPFINNFQFIWTGPLFGTVAVVLIVYSIFRLHLFNVKIIATELLISSLWIFTLLRTLLATEPGEQFFNGLLFFLSLIIGSLLIASVNKEVRSREQIERQEKDLEEANKRQENLIHFISHEIKGYLSKSEAAFAAIVEGDYGEVNDDVKRMSGMALGETRKGVETVMEILSAGNFKKGTVSFTMRPLNFRAEVERAFDDLKPAAEEKHLTYRLTVEDGDYAIVGDADELSKHVLCNLVENAVKYTPQGEVNISLSRKDEKILFSVKDSGVGITPEDTKVLFTEGGRGKDSIKVNAHSTGYGLFIAKQIIEAHHGRIWAQSDGEGKGSTFSFELPSKDSPESMAASPEASSVSASTAAVTSA